MLEQCASEAHNVLLGHHAGLTQDHSAIFASLLKTCSPFMLGPCLFQAMYRVVLYVELHMIISLPSYNGLSAEVCWKWNKSQPWMALLLINLF